ncbi:DUF6473 family protein [Lentibacter sp. XHP0401]|jgi:Domain of unknown function (DUF6473)|uniref:DUF6473 family protein n=1 Tax=Lentibacter sp. XHP0401 TaxID=2984334 RepID=UPI0021E7B360|nr:DUF6473 family protein [Lentibacter sp. XHP0401]MCV2893252.1 DUF6473 family protein [Lentibacter sp. XHP0401]
MSYERIGGAGLDYRLCAYDGSRLAFRGPKRELDEPYVAVLGGTETFGKFIPRPYADRLEDKLGRPCLNFGVMSAGLDAFASDLGVLSMAARAEVVIVQAMGAHRLSNRFYSVHPRRNDRFLRASDAMQRLFKGVDFTEFHFTNHMLRELAVRQPDSFVLLAQELQQAWVARMRQLVERLGKPVVLLWMADHAPEEKRGFAHVASAPFAVTQDMLEALKGQLAGCVICSASAAALARGEEGMLYAPQERQAALHLLGPAVHEEAAEALLPVVEGLFTRR